MILGNNAHCVGDRRCMECYLGFPTKCVCGGFIHCQFIREDWQNNKELIYACDKCGDKFKFPGQRAKPKFGRKRKFQNRKNK